MPLKGKYQAIDFTRLDAFVSDSARVQLAMQIDDKLAGNSSYVTIHEMLGLEPNEVLSSDPRIDDVNKILSDMRRYLRDIGYTLEDDGRPKSKGKGYRYPQNHNQPFKEHRKVRKKLITSEVNDIAAKIAIFIPSAFRDEFLAGTAILASFHLDRNNGGAQISAEDNSLLVGVKHMKEIHEAILNKQKMYIEYTPKYKDVKCMELHPQYLKEYNGRWYVVGRTILLEGTEAVSDPKDRQNLALDRIVDVDITGESEYLLSNSVNYLEYFSDIIGVTHEKEWPKILHIVIKIHSTYVFNLLRTKKLHASQKEVECDGQLYVELDVRPNNELTSKILSFGAAVEVTSPIEYREHLAAEIKKMINYY